MPIPLKFKAALDDSAFMAGLRRIKTASGKLAGGIGRGARGAGRFAGGAAGGLFGVTVAGGAIAAGAGAKKLIDQADAMDHLSAKTGITVQSLAALQEMSATANVSIEELSGSVVRMQRNLEGGSKATEKGLEDMGLSFRELEGMAPEKQFVAIGTALNQMTDQQKKASAAMAIFGRQGTELFDLFRDIEKVDLSHVSEHAEKIAEATKTLAPLADKIDAAKFAVMANSMKGLAATVRGAQHLLGIEGETTPDMLPAVKTSRFFDTLGVGRKQQGLNQDFPFGSRMLSGAHGVGALGTETGMQGGVHSIVRHGDARRARAQEAKIQREAKERQKQTDLLQQIKDAMTGTADLLEDNFD